MDKNCIILIGMPASGKSTVGVILAKILGYDFMDTDLLVQKKEGCRLEEIIDQKGLDQFLSIENIICSTLEASRCVIATGGSVVYGKEAMSHLKSMGTVIYLHVESEALRTRLQDMKGRGVAIREGQTLEELYEERRNLYEKYADHIVSEKEMSLEETVMAVRNLVTL